MEPSSTDSDPDSGAPDVEIKDDYVRVTVRRPASRIASAAATAPDAGND